MYVTRVQLTDIKGFGGPRAVKLELPGQGGWTVIAGRNSSGKSTLLQAVALALGGPSVARSLVADFDGWISMSASSGSVEVQVTYEQSADAFVGPGRRRAGPLPLSLKWARPDLSKLRHVGEPRPVLSAPETAGNERGLRGPWADNTRGWFCAGYGPFRRLVGGSGEAQRVMLAQGPAGRMATLFHEDASLAEGVSWLIDLRLRELEKQAGAGVLLESVLGLLGDGLLPDGFQITRVTSDGVWVTRQGQRGPGIPLRQMSDAYRTVAALVLDIVRQIHAVYGAVETELLDGGGLAVTEPGVVLIDEVDAHLHVTWQRRIGTWLREHFPNIQFIVSSHSPYICQAADEGCLIRLPGPNEDGSAEVVDQELYQRIVYGSADDAAFSELFGMDTPYSERAEEKRKRLVVLERLVYAGTADEQQIREYEGLTELLTSSLETRVAEVTARLAGEE
ncbi:AAA family ATPase [Streptomyces sp. IBSNAI002]|uniref:AAA family ATPase n=1 Tax=Streptomyces sp. IBSNAI002 TaxID=3457500 RepID=UPI003FD01CFD